MPQPIAKCQMIYPDGAERTFQSAGYAFEQYLGECLGGQYNIIDTGANNAVIAINESTRLGAPNRIAMARYGIQAYGPVAIMSKNDAKDYLHCEE